jgi:L-ascorbate metabolism protein UlaG (beta-lactamase superfamily)
MKITKLGHCCFVVELKEGVRIMTDPGAFSTLQNESKGISLVIITHEHSDHLHIESLKNIFKNNPNAIIVTNSAVGKILDGEGMKYVKVEQGETYDFHGVTIKGFGNIHAEIYGTYGQVQNTGYMINNLCFPGDAFEDPNQQVDILALPVAGPWMRVKDAIDYAKQIKPRVAFPMHDAILSKFATFVPKLIGNFLNESNIKLEVLEIGQESEI